MTASKLGEIADIVMGQSPPGETCNNKGLGLALLNGPTEYGVYHPSPVQYTTDARKRARAGDILFCVRGSTTGRMNWADREYAIGRGVAAIRHKERADLQPLVRAAIEYELPDLLMQATGSTFPNVSASQLAGIPWPTIPEAEQSAIAHILGTLDEKIELNRRMSEALEAIARALFKSWFVDFDPVRAKAEGRDPGLPDDIAALFPDSFEDSELKKIPKGWKIVKVEDVSEKVACGPFGSSIKVSTFVSEGIPVISGQHLKGIRLSDEGNNFITTDHADKLKNANVYRGDVIFTHAGNIGQVSFIPETSRYERYILSQRQFYLRCNSVLISPFFVVHYFNSYDGQNKLLANTSSTGVPSISRPVSYLKSIEFTLPPRRLIHEFDSHVKPLHTLAAKLDNESCTLASLRDTLLPKLISGEFRIEDAERFLGNNL